LANGILPGDGPEPLADLWTSGPEAFFHASINGSRQMLE
jgi:hypothetical protein